MKMLKVTALFFLVLFLFDSCRRRIEPIKVIDPYAEEHKYFPIVDGNTWVYESKIVGNISNLLDSFIETGIYSKDSSCINSFKDGEIISSSYWTNSLSKMYCCGGRALIDYGKLNCSSDSVLIHKDTSSNIKIEIHQYCARKYATMVPNYKNVECIKTSQINRFTSGDVLHIVNYFGYEIGLVYREQIRTNNQGKILSREISKLLSHNF